jgi:hypothetical protein
MRQAGIWMLLAVAAATPQGTDPRAARRSKAIAAMVIAIGAWAALVGAARGQCLGDFNTNGMVEINEIITSVNNALSGCGAGRPTPTSPAGGRCPLVFTQDLSGGTLGACSFEGPFNTSACPSFTTEIAWAGTGALLVFALDTNPVAAFGAEVVSATRADLVAWSADQFETIEDLSGTVRLEDDGMRLVIEPTAPPFTIDDCEFRRYVGAFTEHRTEPRRAADRVATAALLARAQQLLADRQRPPVPALRAGR